MPEQELTIHGYEREEGTRTVDANALVDRPSFWSVYLRSACRSESVPFAADQAGSSAMEQALSDRHRWPVLSLRLAPVGKGLWRWLRIVYRNFPEDAGIDFLVTSDLGGAAITIASVEGHSRGPGMCWEELRAVADMPDPTRTAAQRFILALPLLGDVGLPVDARAVVTEALRSVGAVGNADRLAGELLDGDQAEWPIRQGVRMCLGGHAVRHVQDLSLNALREVDMAFGGRYYRSRSGRREYGPRSAGRTMPRWRFEVIDSRADASIGLRLIGHLDGEIRDGEPARLVDGDSTVPVAAVHLDFEDTATRQLVITINDDHVVPPAPGASLHPIDA